MKERDGGGRHIRVGSSVQALAAGIKKAGRDAKDEAPIKDSPPKDILKILEEL